MLRAGYESDPDRRDIPGILRAAEISGIQFRNFLYILFPAAYAAVEAIWAQSGSKALGAAGET